MKTKYKHVCFKETSKNFWECKNNKTDDVLGRVFYYNPWRKFCFSPAVVHGLVFSEDCLRDIADFISQLKAGL